jgi:enoyl-CoA hydratase
MLSRAIIVSRRSFSTSAKLSNQYQTILTAKKNGIATVTLNRPEALNALNSQVMNDLVNALQSFDNDAEVRVVILTGSGKKAFAAGADIKEMATKSFAEVYKTGMFQGWDRIMDIRKPIIAAVNGFALGGGCELAMMCDIIIAADTAKFGQPEITLGVIPGMGGTQRLLRAAGKSKTMEWVLGGEHFSAEQAEKVGLVSRVVPADKLIEEAERVATRIASMSQPVVAAAKDAVNAAFETNLRQGLGYEKRLFYAAFATKDQKEGMGAFITRTKPQWKDE